MEGVGWQRVSLSLQREVAGVVYLHVVLPFDDCEYHCKRGPGEVGVEQLAHGWGGG